MSVAGQKAKYSERADDFRLTPKNGHQNSVRAYVFRFRIPHYQSVRIGEGFDAAISVGYLADSNLSLGASARFCGKDGRVPCLSGVPRHSQDSRRAHRSCLPDAWNRMLEIRIRYQRRRMTLRPFSQVTSASVPSRESREVLFSISTLVP
jgi:hypothetical protein